MSGAVGSSLTASIGFLVLMITVLLGLLFIADDMLLEGAAWLAGGFALTVTLFGFAARKDRKMNLTSKHIWYFDKHNVVFSVLMMLVGTLIFVVSRANAEENKLAIYTGALGVVVFLVALIWFSLSVRD